MSVINEGSTGTYTAQLLDPAGVQVPKAAFTSITLTLYDSLKKTIINGRDEQDVLDANNVTIAVDGTLTWEVQPEDTVIVDPLRRGEWHIAFFVFEWAGGRHTHGYRMRVINIEEEP